MWQVGIDTGGTFTDLVAADEQGNMRRSKVPSTPPNFEKGILSAVEAAGIRWDDISLFAQGTTVTTNALISRQGAKTAVVTTEGFSDVLELRRHNRDEQFNLLWDPPPPLVPGRDRFGVLERVNYAGQEIAALDVQGVREIALKCASRGIEAIAVVFLHSYINPEHEREAVRILQESLPDAVICASSDLIREANEFERTSTTVVNAYLGPVFTNYVAKLAASLIEAGCRAPLVLMHSGGGLLPVASIIKVAARTINSGPAAGVVATANLAMALNEPALISFDMGGTSSDIAVVRNGIPKLVNETAPEFGLPIRFPSVDLVAIGAGGGSIAWIDRAGYPKVGPQSAGAVPGPACYQRGGVEPTVSDANLVLGRLGVEDSLAGQVVLDSNLAKTAVERFASPLSLSIEDGASGILRIANTNMANAIRAMTVQRGLDPRAFALVAFGGAGAMHAVEVAADVGIPRVLIPRTPGVMSAEGLLGADIVHDLVETLNLAERAIDPSFINDRFAILATSAQQALAADQVPEDERQVGFGIDVRYEGQIKVVYIQLEGDFSTERWQEMRKRFYEEYEREFRISTRDLGLEIAALRVRGIGSTLRLPSSQAPIYEEARVETSRHVRFGETWFETTVVNRGGLHSGEEISGPMIIRQHDATVVIPPQVTGHVDDSLIIHLNLKEYIECLTA